MKILIASISDRSIHLSPCRAGAPGIEVVQVAVPVPAQGRKKYPQNRIFTTGTVSFIGGDPCEDGTVGTCAVPGWNLYQQGCLQCGDDVQFDLHGVLDVVGGVSGIEDDEVA